MGYQDSEVLDEYSRQTLAVARIPGFSPKAAGGHLSNIDSVTLIIEGGQVHRRKRRAYDEGELKWNPKLGKFEQT